MHCSTGAEAVRYRGGERLRWAASLVPAMLTTLLPRQGVAATAIAFLTLSHAVLPATDGAVAGFRVREATTRVVDGVYLLDATIDYGFSRESLEAIENGVPVTVVVEVEVMRERKLFDKRVASLKARYRLERHVLTDLYVVRNLNSGETRTYRDFDDMTRGLGAIRGFPMIDRHLLLPGHRYLLRMRARLDIEALPSPLRPLAYLNSLWRLESDWYEWPIEP